MIMPPAEMMPGPPKPPPPRCLVCGMLLVPFFASMPPLHNLAKIEWCSHCRRYAPKGKK